MIKTAWIKRGAPVRAFLFEVFLFLFFTGMATFSVYFIARFVLGV
jgi:hypothetical protein